MTTQSSEPVLETAYFGLGCFWGAEALFRYRPGVVETEVGDVDASIDNPSPAEARRTTGQVEVVKVTFDSAAITYADLLSVFWGAIDPTMAPRPVDATKSTPHPLRSAIFWTTPEQERQALASRANEQLEYQAPIVTDIEAAGSFSPAPDADQRYLEKGGWLDKLTGPSRTPNWTDDSNKVTDSALAGEFGGAIHAISVPWLRALFLNQCHVDAAIRSLRSWLELLEAVDDRSTQAAPTADHDHAGTLPVAAIGRRRLLSARLSANFAAASTMFTMSRPDATWTFIVNHRPGNGVARLKQNVEVSTHARLHREDDRLDEFSGTGSGGGLHADPFTRQPARGPARCIVDLGRDPDAWHTHVPPLDVTVECGEPTPHRLRFSVGRLWQERMTEQGERERTLAVLAGDGCRCAHLLRGWDPRWIVEHQILRDHGGLPEACLSDAEGRPRFSTGRQANRPTFYNMSGGLAESLFSKPVPDLDDGPTPAQINEVARTLGTLWFVVPGPLQLRWILSGLAAIEADRDRLDRIDRNFLDRGLFACLRSAALSSLWQWCRLEPTVAYGSFDFRHLNRGDEPFAYGTIDAESANATIGVPFKWLTHVWARDIAVVDRQLVLTVEGPPEATTLEAVVASWQKSDSENRPATIETRHTALSWDGTDWHLSD